MKSRIFTEAEQNSLESRLEGNKKDPTGIFSSRIKPKIIEMLEYWFPKKRKLKKLVGRKGEDGTKKE